MSTLEGAMDATDEAMRQEGQRMGCRHRRRMHACKQARRTQNEQRCWATAAAAGHCTVMAGPTLDKHLACLHSLPLLSAGGDGENFCTRARRWAFSVIRWGDASKAEKGPERKNG